MGTTEDLFSDYQNSLSEAGGDGLVIYDFDLSIRKWV